MHWILESPPEMWQRLEHRRVKFFRGVAAVRVGGINIVMPPGWHATAENRRGNFARYWVQAVPRENSFRMLVAAPATPCLGKTNSGRGQSRPGSRACAKSRGGRYQTEYSSRRALGEFDANGLCFIDWIKVGAAAEKAKQAGVGAVAQAGPQAICSGICNRLRIQLVACTRLLEPNPITGVSWLTSYCSLLTGRFAGGSISVSPGH